MKTILLLLVSLTLTAQSTLSVFICDVKPDTVCPGDSVEFDYIYQSNLVLPLQVVSLQLANTTNTATFWQGTEIFLNAFPVNSSGCSVMYFQVPVTFPIGNAFVMTPTHIKFIYIKACDPTGIKEHTLENTPPIYFDIMNRRTDPIPGELLIEQRGNNRRKIIIKP